MTVKEILESYEEITVEEQVLEGVLFFTLFEKKFLFFAPDEDDPSSKAAVYLYNDDLLDFPHVMLRENTITEGKDLPNGTYRWICLFEQESIVNTIVSYEDKIFDCVDRLIELLSMTPVECEREFQKEFMYYWNSESVGEKEFSVYLEQATQFTELDAFYGAKKVRLIQKGLKLTDIDDRDKNERKWIHHIENDVFYIPVTDNRGILPPHRGYQWTANEVQGIVYGKQIEHISDETFRSIKSIVPKTQDVILVFGMRSALSNVTFALKAKCKNGNNHTLLEKLLSDIVALEPLATERKDYSYLCEQIGNDIGLLKKRILLIGAGSLGSYVAFELVKNGAKYLKIYDGDKLEEENVLRWAYGGIGKGSNKATTIQILLKLLHPEISIEACGENISTKSLMEEISDKDLIIFTIGSSDEQIKLNSVLKKSNCPIPAIFVWLEEGGTNSHILFVNYQMPGCFECLYTDSNGEYVNNRARKNSSAATENGIIRNGCGGTRAAYGTAILLRTTAALLNVIQDYDEHTIIANTLIDITPERITVSDTEFPMEACNCCGDTAK